jgi:diguanylate cyclase (GGDEF)-like protein
VSKGFVTLHLGRGGSPDAHEAEILRQTLDEAFLTLVDVLTAGDAFGLGAAVPPVEQCRSELANGASAEALDPVAKSCFEATRTSAAHAKALATEQRSQIAALVAMVRETVATVTGNQASLDETLTGSAERFARLAQVNDLRQIQAQLVQEVSTLKRIAAEKKEAWEQTFSQLGTRLTTLETQLNDTRKEAAIDPLTNVANRRTFERACHEWLGPSRPSFVLALIDVDNFKTVNDELGHAMGDRILVTVAQTIANSQREADLLARIGGDEFAVLAAGIRLSQAEARFTTIARNVAKACRELTGSDEIAPSISVGLAEVSAGDTLESLQQRADTALYQAKRHGKGRVATKSTALIRDLLNRR